MIPMTMQSTPIRPKHRRIEGRAVRTARGGFTVVELLMTTILVGAAVSIALPILSQVTLHSRTAAQREQALQAAANALERLTARPFDELTASAAAEAELPEEIARQLPEADLQVDIATADEGRAKRIQVRLSWTTRNGRRIAPIRLTAWRYRENS
jgi:type II secretory pathway pseudopilin PulG